MATSIRLTRMGRKQAPFYRLVVADSRVRRDGDYIDSLGHYNPMPDAYELSVDHAKAMEWLGRGAQPTDTARSLLRNEGVLLRWHLTKAGTPAEEIEAKVEEYRSRRAKFSDSIKAKSKSELAAWIAAKEKTAADKLKKQKAAAEVVEEPAAESAEASASEDSTES
jgi:small subunit ribosomal protein S16